MDTSSDESEVVFYSRKINKVKLVCGPSSVISNYPEGQLSQEHYDDFIYIRLEKDLFMQRKAKHFIKLDTEVHVPDGFVAIVESINNPLEVACRGEFIHHGSHNKRIIFFLENLTDKTIHLNKYDVVGQLRLYRLSMACVNYFPQIHVKNYPM